jgi:DNA-binding XRE family transcriptional regulator
VIVYDAVNALAVVRQAGSAAAMGIADIALLLSVLRVNACAPCQTFSEMSTLCTTLGIMTITPAQCRAARGLVEMDQAALANAANVSRNTIVSFEKGQRTPGANNLAAIRSALEAAGVIFIDSNGNGPGVRLRKD